MKTVPIRDLAIDDHANLALLINALGDVYTPSPKRWTRALDEYIAAGGDPYVLVPRFGKVPEFKERLAGYYESAQKRLGLSFISSLRGTLAIKSCPMCGSLSHDTLDHYLPKGDFPEFAVFSLNLIPSCFVCNVGKNAAYKYNQEHERLIHPYFDKFVSRDFLAVKIYSPYEIPEFRPVVKGLRGKVRQIAEFHVLNHIPYTPFFHHMISSWEALCRMKRNASMFNGSPTADKVETLARERKEYADNQYGQNNWESAFWRGVAEDRRVVKFVASQIGLNV